MIKKITKIGNSHGIIFDHALMELAHLKPGDEVNITVHGSGTLTVEPVSERIGPDRARAAATEIIHRNNELFDRLSR